MLAVAAGLLLARQGPDELPPEIAFLEQVAIRIDALEQRCAEPRGELTRVVLDLQHRRLARGEQGSALDILNGLLEAVPPTTAAQPCAGVAESLFAPAW